MEKPQKDVHSTVCERTCAHLPCAEAPDMCGADVEPAVRACAARQHPSGNSQVVWSVLLWRQSCFIHHTLKTVAGSIPSSVRGLNLKG